MRFCSARYYRCCSRSFRKEDELDFILTLSHWSWNTNPNQTYSHVWTIAAYQLYLYLWIHFSSLTEHVALAVQHLKWRPVVRIKYSSMATYMHNTYFSLIFWKKANEETNSVFSCVPKTTQTKANMFFQIVSISINNGYGLLFCIYLFICFVGSVSSDDNAVDA